MYTEYEARKLVIDAGIRLMASGLIARTWGNISARISDTEFVITPSGRAYENLKPEDLVKCKIADCSYEGTNKPSSEKGIHADGYRLRPECNFIIHTHQFYATVVGVTGQALKDPFVPCAAYGMPSTGKLRKAVASAVQDNSSSKAVLMTRHGALVLGNNYDDAFDIASKLEEDCKKEYLSTCPGSDGREIELISNRMQTLHPPIDDLAQIAGISIRCVDRTASDSRKARALHGRNALLIKGDTPICTGPDCEAVMMLLRKGCAAALYADTMKGLGTIDALLQRVIYVKKYSKKK